MTQPTIFIYHTEKEGHHSTEFKDRTAKRPEVGEDFTIHPYLDCAQRVTPLEVIELTTPSGIEIVEVLCDIPEWITVTMGCGHTQSVPNNSSWIMADGDPSAKCEECWSKVHFIREYNHYSCYDN